MSVICRRRRRRRCPPRRRRRAIWFDWDTIVTNTNRPSPLTWHNINNIVSSSAGGNYRYYHYLILVHSTDMAIYVWCVRSYYFFYYYIYKHACLCVCRHWALLIKTVLILKLLIRLRPTKKCGTNKQANMSLEEEEWERIGEDTTTGSENDYPTANYVAPNCDFICWRVTTTTTNDEKRKRFHVCLPMVNEFGDKHLYDTIRLHKYGVVMMMMIV